MEMFQETLLETKLEELLLTGATFIGWPQIYHWYRVEKITKTPWRDMYRRWQIMCESYGLEGIEITARGVSGSATGGVRLIRPYIESIDGNQIQLAELI